jgi:hypothetical protein
MPMFETNHPPSMLLMVALVMCLGVWVGISQRSVAQIAGFGLAVTVLVGLAVRNAIRRYHKRHT